MSTTPACVHADSTTLDASEERDAGDHARLLSSHPSRRRLPPAELAPSHVRSLAPIAGAFNAATRQYDPSLFAEVREDWVRRHMQVLLPVRSPPAAAVRSPTALSAVFCAASALGMGYSWARAPARQSNGTRDGRLHARVRGRCGLRSSRCAARSRRACAAGTSPQRSLQRRRAGG